MKPKRSSLVHNLIEICNYKICQKYSKFSEAVNDSFLGNYYSVYFIAKVFYIFIYSDLLQSYKMLKCTLNSAKKFWLQNPFLVKILQR